MYIPEHLFFNLLYIKPYIISFTYLGSVIRRLKNQTQKSESSAFAEKWKIPLKVLLLLELKKAMEIIIQFHLSSWVKTEVQRGLYGY
jgi:hypothetical protein